MWQRRRTVVGRTPAVGGIDVGIDVGGTHTRILVARGPSANDTSANAASTNGEVTALTTSWRRGTLFSDPHNATRLLGLIPGGVVGQEGVCIAVGAHGCDNRAQCDLFTAWLREHHPGPVLVVNDAELFGPAMGITGAISVVCGTGSIVVGRDPGGELVKVGGHGWLLGDPGAAPSLVRESVVAFVDAHDRGEPPGILAQLLMRHYGSPDPVQWGYDFTDDAAMTAWGALAPLVFDAADRGDALAAGVVEADGRQLAADVHALRAKGVTGADVVVGGSVIVAQSRLFGAFTGALAAAHAVIRPHLLRDAPVKGALALAGTLRSYPG
jgi:N-acetylglucosamine kinase-like BadF-type ATPase